MFAELESAHRDTLVDVEVKAEYDPESNRGSFAVEVVLLSRVSFRRGLRYSNVDSSHGNVWGFSPACDAVLCMRFSLQRIFDHVRGDMLIFL